VDIPILGRRPESGADLQEMQVRLLVCSDCKSMEELPDYEGHPEDDTLLKVLLEKHVWPTGTEHTGNIFRIPLKFWGNATVKDSIVKQIQAGVSGGVDDVEAGWYDTKSTFQEDAMACFSKHLRPVGRCPDWKHDSKKLVPKTAAERKDAGMDAPGKDGAPTTYLCQFCPASIFMHTKARETKGLYK
jgi:hypothetical protein